MASPPSQTAKDRPISFRLQGIPGGNKTYTMVIRPEELTRAEPALQLATPTFQGAFLDDFGAGLTTIQISGHTGWGQGSRPDGIKAFQDLHDIVWKTWRAARVQAISQGKDPSTIKLVFVDQLNEYTSLVAPGKFILKRSRSRPLLSMFQIDMTVLSDNITDTAEDPLAIRTVTNPAGVLAGVKSLQSSIGKIQSAAANVRGFIDKTIAGPIHEFMGITQHAMGSVIGLVDTARGIVGAEAAQMAGIAGDLSQAGRNLFVAYNAVATLPDFAGNQVSEVSSAYENAFCVLRNAFTAVKEYPDYDGLYGASVCSSTVGGAPLSIYGDVNPWDYVLPGNVSLASISPIARSNLDLLAVADPILRPMGIAEIGSRAAALVKGIGFSL